jgi:hypothetical protein
MRDSIKKKKSFISLEKMYVHKNKKYTYVVRLLYCGITTIMLHWAKSFCRCERFITHAKDEENNTTRGIGCGVSEAFVLFVVDAILGNDLCDIKVHITAEIENPKNRSPLSL